MLREQGGLGVLAERLMPRLGSRDVVDSIRNPAEVATLRRVPGFVLLGVDAPAELRFARSRLRARPGDPESFAEFAVRERQENSTNPAGQQLRATFELADRVVENDGDLDALRLKVDALLDALCASSTPR
jgi:dephospho-CoA kinase